MPADTLMQHAVPMSEPKVTEQDDPPPVWEELQTPGDGERGRIGPARHHLFPSMRVQLS